MIEIRRATRADAQAAFTIRREAIRAHCIGPYSREDMLIWTQGELSEGYADLVEQHFYLACVDQTPVATIMLGPERGELGALFVLPGAMGQGIARQLVRHLEGLAREAGWTRLRLDATLNAAPFYRGCGFVGKAEGVYQSPSGLSLRCVPMTKAL